MTYVSRFMQGAALLLVTAVIGGTLLSELIPVYSHHIRQRIVVNTTSTSLMRPSSPPSPKQPWSPQLPIMVGRTLGPGSFLNLPGVELAEQKQKRCLKFIHIPKTAGSSIDQLGFNLKLNWGPNDRSLRCSNMSLCRQTTPLLRPCCWPKSTTACSLWHYPPSVDEQLAQIYANCSTFCVVRDPIMRFMSEYFYMSKHKHVQGDLCDPGKFEQYANETLQRLGEDPFVDDCHLVPQAYYLSSKDGRRLCDHIIRYEHLQTELTQLLKWYHNLSETASQLRVVNQARRCDSVAMSPQLRRRLQEFFRVDYELGLGQLGH
ncbi:unnamed protein product [Durusdinium trenchii]|uniref:Sulfotransferase n=1 Tax=Durusdinium trenchii TaxID=1381693 RepID=A0ABP0MY70_9DINO